MSEQQQRVKPQRVRFSTWRFGSNTSGRVRGTIVHVADDYITIELVNGVIVKLPATQRDINELFDNDHCTGSGKWAEHFEREWRGEWTY